MLAIWSGISYSSHWQWRHGAGVVCTHDLQQYKNLFTMLWPAVLTRTCTCQEPASLAVTAFGARSVSGARKITRSGRHGDNRPTCKCRKQPLNSNECRERMQSPLTISHLRPWIAIDTKLFFHCLSCVDPSAKTEVMHCNNDRWELIKPQQCTRDQIQRYSITAGTRCAEKVDPSLFPVCYLCAWPIHVTRAAYLVVNNDSLASARRSTRESDISCTL